MKIPNRARHASRRLLQQAGYERLVTRAFHRLYYYRGTWLSDTKWLGYPARKCPLDLWVYQELLHELRPELIIETGSADGGAGLYLATMCDIVGTGRVVSIDIDGRDDRPEHERLRFVTASSTDVAIVDEMRALATEAGAPILVILDSDHSQRHVLDELRCYADIVTPGSYLIVEDTNVNGHPVFQEHGPGPMEAVHDFLKERRDFEIDRSKEKFLMTFNPDGFLRKKG